MQRHHWTVLLGIGFACVLARPGFIAAQAATRPVQEDSPPIAEQTLAPGDLIAVSVVGSPELQTEARLSETGTFRMPEAGAVRLAGESASEAAATLAARLQQTYLLDPQVQVLIKQFAPEPVTVTGAVVTPGVYSARTYPDLGAMLAAAGGIRHAAGSELLVQPGGGGTALRFPVASLSQGSAASSLPLRAGEMIRVVPAGQIYVAGDVVRPGAYTLPAGGLTLLRALALAGGARHDSLTRRTRIVHQTPDGDPVTTWVNTDRVRRGSAADPALEPDDLVYIPWSPAKTGLFAGATLVAETTARIIAGVIIFHWVPPTAIPVVREPVKLGGQ